MNVRLNLLPWRERRQLAAVRQFRVVLTGALTLSLCVVMLIDHLAHQRLRQQAAASMALQSRNQSLDRDLAGLDGLREQRMLRERQLQALVETRAAQTRVPLLLERIETAIPQGLRLTGLEVDEQHVQIDGLAASAAVLAEFMRALQRAPGLLDLELRQLTNQADGDAFVLMARVAASSA